MFARFAIILSLVLQQVSFAAVIRAGGDGDCEMVPCCQIVETTSCCGETIVEMVCGVSAGSCECVVDLGPERAPVPPAPARSRTDSTATAISLLRFDSPSVCPEFTLGDHTLRPRTFIRTAGTHNQQLALLGVWRT